MVVVVAVAVVVAVVVEAVPLPITVTVIVTVGAVIRRLLEAAPVATIEEVSCLPFSQLLLRLTLYHRVIIILVGAFKDVTTVIAVATEVVAVTIAVTIAVILAILENSNANI